MKKHSDEDEQKTLADYVADSVWANDGGNLLSGDPELTIPEPNIAPNDRPQAA